MATATVNAGFLLAGTNMDLFDIGLLVNGTMSSQTGSSYFVNVGDERLVFTGTGFTPGGSAVTSGTVTGIEYLYQSQSNFSISGFAIAATQFETWAATHDNAAAKAAIFAGADVVEGGPLDDLLRSYGGADSLLGGAGNDTLDGGDGGDTINGGGGHDVITAGAGADIVIVGLGQSGTMAIDSITDWSSSDQLIFASVPATSADYAEDGRGDFASAAAYANGLIAAGTANLVAVYVGGDVIVFADSANNNGSADDVVILTGSGLADVSYTNFTTTPTNPTPPVTPPGGSGGFGGSTPPPATGTEGDDLFTPTAGADNFNGGGGNDLIDGGDGADILAGGVGNDTLQGAAGDDALDGGAGTNYMRGGDGQDQMVGGAGFDDINGNAGNDTESGGFGDDWVVGGRDNDRLSGDAGGDIVWGNLGDDTLDGGLDNDQVRGGQANDVLTGGAGDDYVSGDRGDDTVSGGLGADIFHGSQDAGLDRVLDFSLAEGDRVMLDPGTTYTVAQIGSDTVIDMGGANQMILVGVQLSTLPQGWIFA